MEQRSQEGLPGPYYLTAPAGAGQNCLTANKRKEPKVAKYVVSCLVALLISAAIADATTVGTVQLASHGNWYSGTAYISGDGYTNTNVYTGLYSWTKTAWTEEGEFTPNHGWCVDIPQNPGTPYNVDDDIGSAPVHTGTYGPGEQPMGPDKRALIEELFGRYFQWDYVENPGSHVEVNEILGICIWEIVYETYKPIGGYDLTTDDTGSSTDLSDGGFYVNSNADTATANSWLDSLDGTGAKMPMRALISDTYQDFLYPIPEPLTVLGMFLGLGSVGAYIRRRRMA